MARTEHTPGSHADPLEELCLLQFDSALRDPSSGDNLSEAGSRLKERLNRFLKLNTRFGVSRQAVLYWLRGQTHPRRADSFEFLRAYLESEIQLGSLPHDRKRRFTALHEKLSASIQEAPLGPILANAAPADPNARIRSLPRGGVAIKNTLNKKSISDLGKLVVGGYVTYRMRLSETLNPPMAREYLSIYESGPDIRFRHWYRPRGGALASFDGVVALFGNVIWLFGHSKVDLDRLRILNFRFTNPRMARDRRYHWGLMLSDLSGAAHEPASCRIVLERIEEKAISSDDQLSLDRIVGFVSVGDLPDEKLGGQLARFTDNHATAHSLPGTTSPVGETKDLVLQVNRETIESLAASLKAGSVS